MSPKKKYHHQYFFACCKQTSGSKNHYKKINITMHRTTALAQAAAQEQAAYNPLSKVEKAKRKQVCAQVMLESLENGTIQCADPESKEFLRQRIQMSAAQPHSTTLVYNVRI
jgi:hypothetical protein